ncbi:hypothetical protein [Fructobacillus cardui]|uniref:hypothetical protein n=1 Tax=Fructobacillus cardui TaxID=2893170 RepID=UPI0030C7EB94
MLLIASYYLRPFFNRLGIRQIKTITYLALTLMVVGQVLILIFLPVSVYHDPYRVLSPANQLAAGDHVWQNTYFWRYLNNVPITYILSKFFALGRIVHLSNNITIHLLTLGLLNAFIVLVLKTSADLKRPQSTFLGLLAFLTATPFAYTYYLQVFILICQPCWTSWLFSDFYSAGHKLALPGPRLKSAWVSLPQHCWAC